MKLLLFILDELQESFLKTKSVVISLPFRLTHSAVLCCLLEYSYFVNNVENHELETGAKKIGLVFWAISDIKNSFTAFC